MEVKDLVGEYLRGYMAVNDNVIKDGDVTETAVYLYFNGFVAKMAFVCYDSNLRDDEWYFEVIDEAPERDSRYKAIGEYIEAVNVGKKEEDRADYPTSVSLIKTKTKILNFETEYFDSNYPSSIWDVI